MPYSKLNILTELSANGVNFISVGTVNSIFVEIQPDSTNIKNDPRIYIKTLLFGLMCYQRCRSLLQCVCKMLLFAAMCFERCYLFMMECCNSQPAKHMQAASTLISD